MADHPSALLEPVGHHRTDDAPNDVEPGWRTAGSTDRHADSYTDLYTYRDQGYEYADDNYGDTKYEPAAEHGAAQHEDDARYEDARYEDARYEDAEYDDADYVDDERDEYDDDYDDAPQDGPEDGPEDGNHDADDAEAATALHPVAAADPDEDDYSTALVEQDSPTAATAIVSATGSHRRVAPGKRRRAAARSSRRRLHIVVSALAAVALLTTVAVLQIGPIGPFNPAAQTSDLNAPALDDLPAAAPIPAAPATDAPAEAPPAPAEPSKVPAAKKETSGGGGAPGKRAVARIEQGGGQVINVGSGGSISSAASKAGPGDTVVIAGGTYNESLDIQNDGSSSAPITFQAAPGENVVLSGGASNGGIIHLSGRSFIRLIGLSVRGSDGFGIVGDGASNITVRDCEVSGSSNGGVVFTNGSNITVEHCDVKGNNSAGEGASHEAITFEGVNGFTAQNNVVRDNGEEGIDAKYGSKNGKILNNTLTGNRGPNIYIDSASNITISGNTISNATGSSKAGIGLAVEDLADVRQTSGIKITNNVVKSNAGGGVSFWAESSGTFSDIQILNNTLSNNGRGGIDILGGSFGGNNVQRGNTFSGNASEISGDSGAFSSGGGE
ncbi:right-handed parallel beta-helix repeat-containing protein [Pseudonocardia sp. TRM90224]|uniref:right-handed parallel beta-helix repeat-containing protein n=1 Tax=Pseudonocardia sp. TRM90224 TaxID=2812678 RepID=UPI001E6100D1|nr:right-handed parallel beta-helix repeat-containing protein [Pseudonocardia sp. TRM90224]